MEREHFDTDLFIDEIHNRPSIWNLESPEYKNKILKKRCWEEIVDIFSGPGDGLEKKKALGSALMKKWKNIRDNYTRESKKRKNRPSGSGSTTHSPYVYFHKLQFLEKSVTNKNTDCNLPLTSDCNLTLTSEDDAAGADNEDLVAAPRECNEHQRKKLKVTEVDKQIVELIQSSLRKKDENEKENLMKADDDKLFCLSLYTELKKVPENRRLTTKIQLLNVLEKAQSSPQLTPLQTNEYRFSTPVYSGYTIPRPAPAPSSTTTTSSTTTPLPPIRVQWSPTEDSDTFDLYE